MNTITVDKIVKNYGNVHAVIDLDFKVNSSECFGILGPNGAGKTTMMKMLYGMNRRTSGAVDIFGFDPLTDELKIKFISGIVPQDNNLDVELTVMQNLLVYSKFYGLSKIEAKKRIGYLLDFMELSDKIDSQIRELSGGMQRRLVIARALINNPKILFLDEPTTGLDPQVRHLIWNKVRTLKKEGVSVLITTHYMEEAFQLCDRIIMMNKGLKVLEGSPEELISGNIEKYVLEIFDPEKPVAVVDRTRVETTNNITYLYSDNIEVLENMTRSLKAGEFYLRQSNLEDVFLKTTGRGLNE
jgi:lipooligosaccharide transport system ATP-binding protein